MVELDEKPSLSPHKQSHHNQPEEFKVSVFKIDEEAITSPTELIAIEEMQPHQYMMKRA